MMVMDRARNQSHANPADLNADDSKAHRHDENGTHEHANHQQKRKVRLPSFRDEKHVYVDKAFAPSGWG